jgi:hypothetical protein
MLYGIQRDQISEVWPEVCPWIEAAAETTRGKWDAEDIRAGLLTGEDQLWIWKTDTAFAVGVTRLANYPKQRVCNLRIVTGTSMAEWAQPCIETIEAWARENGCHAMEFQARPGWERFLKGRGYDKTHVYMERAL